MTSRISALVLFVGMSLITACGGDGAGGNGVDVGPEEFVVEVTLTEFAVEMETTTIPAGVPVTFVFTNNGVLEHNIILESADAVDDPLQYPDGESAKIDTIAPGDTESLTYVFKEGENFQVGTLLQLGCHLPGHFEAGMFQAFSVEP